MDQQDVCVSLGTSEGVDEQDVCVSVRTSEGVDVLMRTVQADCMIID